MSIPPVGLAGSSCYAQSTPSCLEILNGALRALSRDNPNQAEGLIRQLPQGVAARIFFLACEAGGNPRNRGERFGEEAFFGQNQRSLEVNVKKTILAQVIREESSSKTPYSPASPVNAASRESSANSPGFSLSGQILSLLYGLGNTLTGRSGSSEEKRSAESFTLPSRLQFGVQIHRTTGLIPNLVDIISEYAIECLGEEEWLQYFRSHSQRTLGLLNSALDALKRNDQDQANGFVQQLSPEIAHRIFQQVWEKSGRPLGDNFGEEAFFGKNQRSVDVSLKKSVLNRVIGEQSSPVDFVSPLCPAISLDSWVSRFRSGSTGDLSTLPLRSGSLEQIRNATHLTPLLVKMIHIYAIDCFGAEEWRRYFHVDVEQMPELLSEEFCNFWYGPDPIDSTQRVCDTHLPPVFRPEFIIRRRIWKTSEFVLPTYKTHRYDLQVLHQLVRDRSRGLLSHEGLSRIPNCKIFGSSWRPQWLVMRKDVIGRNHQFSTLQQFTEFLNGRTGAHYEDMIFMIDLATVVFARNAATGERPLGDTTGAEGRLTMSFTSAQEQGARDDLYRFVLGGYSSNGQLRVGLCGGTPSKELGMALLRGFPSAEWSHHHV